MLRLSAVYAGLILTVNKPITIRESIKTTLLNFFIESLHSPDHYSSSSSSSDFFLLNLFSLFWFPWLLHLGLHQNSVCPSVSRRLTKSAGLRLSISRNIFAFSSNIYDIIDKVWHS